MRSFLDRLYNWSAAVGASFVALIAILMVGQSILREFGVKTGAVNDVVAWSCAAAAFLCMAHAFKHGDFVRVTLLLEKLPPKTRQWFEVVTLSIAVIGTAYLAHSACAFTLESYQFNDVATGLLPMPLWVVQSTFAYGACLLCIAVVDELILVLRGNRPTYVTAVEARHAQGDFSSEV